MNRIWYDERKLNSRALRLTTFIGLGGAKGIVQKHLDDVLNRLPYSQRATALDVLSYLVTPSGTKVALEPAYLAEMSKATRCEGSAAAIRSNWKAS